jgi:transcriptional regulator with XRE-family HTH domain
MSLGTTLLKHRRKNNYSQKQVADLLEVSQSTYCDWESDTSFPKTENIVKISQLYEIEISELLPTGNINVVNSPSSITNSPNSKVETPEALLKVAEGLDKLITLMEKMLQKE